MNESLKAQTMLVSGTSRAVALDDLHRDAIGASREGQGSRAK
jgi:hypothetical protein